MPIPLSLMQDQLAELTVSVSRLSIYPVGPFDEAQHYILLLYENLSDLKNTFKPHSRFSEPDRASDQWDSLFVKIKRLINSTPIKVAAATANAIEWNKVKVIAKELKLHVLRQRVNTDALPQPTQQDFHKVKNDLRDLDDESRRLTQHVEFQPSGPQPPTSNSTRDSGYHSADESVCFECVTKQKAIDESHASRDEVNAKAEAFLLSATSCFRKSNECFSMTEVYEHLENVRNIEVQRKISEGDQAGADRAELQLQKIYSAKASMLEETGQLPQAEQTMRNVLKERKRLSREGKTSRTQQDVQDLRAARRQLCTIWRLQNKLQNAEAGYRREWNRQWTDEEDSPKDDRWINYNGYELGCVLVEEGKFEEGLAQHREVLKARRSVFGVADGDAFAIKDEDTLQSAVQVIELQLNRMRIEAARDTVLQNLIPQSNFWTPEAWHSAYRFGSILNQQNRYAQAREILRRAWEEAISIPGSLSNDIFDCGWQLGVAAYYLDQPAFRQARDVLEHLLTVTEGGDSSDTKIFDVKSLLAWTYRRLDNTENATEHARAVWAARKDKHPPDYPSLSVGPLLIWLYTQSNNEDDRTERAEVWKSVLAHTRKRVVDRCAGDAAVHDKLRQTAKCWKDLSADMMQLARDRGYPKGSTLAKNIAAEAAKLEKHCGECSSVPQQRMPGRSR